MSDMDYTHKLPAEMFSAILGELSVPDLLSASLVNGQWRRNARDHPKFWQNISIRTLSMSAIEFFETRLSLGGARNIKSLRIIIPGLPWALLTVLQVFSRVSENINRIEELEIVVHNALAGLLFRALTSPAPVLRSFAIHFDHSDRMATNSCPLIYLPDRIFAAACPLLRTVHINGAATASLLPTAFRTTTYLRIRTHTKFSMLPAWFDCFPHLKELSIFAHSWQIPKRAINAIPTSALRRLQKLELVFEEDSYAVMKALSCLHVPHMTWSLSARQVAEELLPRFTLGPLRLKVCCDDADSLIVHLHFESCYPDAGRTLHFVGLRDELELTSGDTYFSPGILGRLKSLRLDSSLAFLLKRIDRLPALTTIEYNMCLDDWPRAERPFAHLNLPVLQEVVLYNDGRFVDRLMTNSVEAIL